MAKQKLTFGDRIFDVVIYVFLAVATILAVYPLIYSVSASISDPDLLNTGKVLLLPKGFTLEGYRAVFRYDAVLIGYRNTVLYTAFGTLINIIVTMMTAYALSRKDLAGRKLITVLMTFTMWFSGGLIPTFLVVNSLKLVNTPYVMVLIAAVSMWNTIIARSYIQSSIPYEIQEAARIDGCNDFRIFGRIIIPLSTPVIAVLALYYAIEHWNSYFNALIYLTDRKLQPLQIVLREILIQNQTLDMMSTDNMLQAVEMARLASTMKYSLIVIASVPMLIIYPFIQKYFVKGIMLGAVKG